MTAFFMCPHKRTVTRYCLAASPEGEEVIPLVKWLKDNHFTQSQVNNLLRKRILKAVKFKGKYYVKPNNGNIPMHEYTHPTSINGRHEHGN